METPEQHRARVARHEAAHAVSRVKFGHPFDWVDIIPTDERGGRVHYPDEWDENLTPERARESAIIALAARADGELFEFVGDDGSSSDVDHAKEILQKAYPEAEAQNVRRLLNEVYYATYELIKQPEVQAAITALANALLRKETIHAEEAIAIIQAALQTQPPPINGKRGWGKIGDEWEVYERRQCRICDLWETAPNEYHWLTDTGRLVCEDCWKYLQARGR